MVPDGLNKFFEDETKQLILDVELSYIPLYLRMGR